MNQQPSRSPTGVDIPEFEESYGHVPLDYENEDTAQLKRILIAVVIIMLVVAGVGFGLYSFFKNRESVSPIAEERLENLVNAELGGTVALGEAKIIVPPGALSEDTLIEIEKIGEGDVTDVYLFKPEGLTFLKPVEIIIPYKEENIKGYLELEYTVNAQAPGPIPFEVDKENKILRAEVTKF